MVSSSFMKRRRKTGFDKKEREGRGEDQSEKGINGVEKTEEEAGLACLEVIKSY